MPRLREFTLEDTDAAAWNRISGMLCPRFRISPDGTRTVRRTWLDTFDWRLYRAGSTLEYLSGAGAHELALVTAAGERITTAVPRLSWPHPAGRVPAALVRDHIAPIAGIRALIPVAVGTSTLRTLRVLDGHDTTVVHLTIDEASPHGAAARPRRLVIAAIRGYEAHACRLERMLADLPGLTAAQASAFQLAVAATGRRAGDYTSRVDVALTPSAPAGAAIATVLLRLLDIVEANVDGVIQDIDTEFLHDLRVAVRRTRAALKLAGDALPGEIGARFAPEFRWLGQLTTPTRDLDVHLLGFAATAGGLVTAAAADLAPLHDSLLRYRAVEHGRLVRGLRSERFARIVSEWRAALGEKGPQRAPFPPSGRAAGDSPIAELAAARIRRAYRRLAKAGAAITPASPDEDLHLVRKRGKELRYLLEFFAPLHDPATHRTAVGELKRLQDCLGEIQDGCVQREAIRTLADRMVTERAAPAATLLAMGELAAQLDAAAGEARGEFGARFAQFASARNTRRIASLTTAAG